MGQANKYQQQNYEPMLDEFSDSVITYDEMAEIVIDKAIFSFKKEKLMKEIDFALDSCNQTLFHQLSEKYNSLLKKYSYLNEYV